MMWQCAREDWRRQSVFTRYTAMKKEVCCFGTSSGRRLICFPRLTLTCPYFPSPSLRPPSPIRWARGNLPLPRAKGIALTSPLIPMTHSHPLVRPLQAFAVGKFLSSFPKRLKSPFEAERNRGGEENSLRDVFP